MEILSGRTSDRCWEIVTGRWMVQPKAVSRAPSMEKLLGKSMDGLSEQSLVLLTANMRVCWMDAMMGLRMV